MPGDKKQSQRESNTEKTESVEFQNGLLLSGLQVDDTRRVLKSAFRSGIAGMISIMKPIGDGRNELGGSPIDNKQLERDNWEDLWIEAAIAMASSQHRQAVEDGNLDLNTFDIGFSRFTIGQNVGAGIGVLHIYPHYINNGGDPQFNDVDNLLKTISTKEDSFDINQLLLDTELSNNEVKYVRSVITRLISTESTKQVFERFKIEIIETLIKFLTREISVQKLSSTLGLLKIMPNSKVSGESVLQAILEEASPEHVINLRDDIGTDEKFRYLSQASLNDVGLQAVEAHNADTLPTMTNPHLEYFEPLIADEDTIRKVTDNLAVLQITKGCSHNCLHCALAPKHKVDAMPFYRILQLLEYGDDEAGELSGNDKHMEEHNLPNSYGLMMYDDSDLLDYYDPLYGTDAGDVISVILEKYPSQFMNITTRGWYVGNTIAERAFKKILKLSKKYDMNIRISIDSYDVLDNDIMAYAARIGKMLNLFDSYDYIPHGTMNQFIIQSNRESQELFSIIMHILNSGHSLKRSMHAETSSLVGNAKKLQDAGKMTFDNTTDSGDCMYGGYIYPNGEFAYNVRKPDKNIPGQVHILEKTDIKLWNESDVINPLIPKKRRRADKGFYIDVDESGFYKKDISK